MTVRPVFLALRRLRLLAVLAGMAWTLGITPPAPVRLLVLALVAVGLVLDQLSDAGLRPGPVRLTGWGRPGGDDQ